MRLVDSIRDKFFNNRASEQPRPSETAPISISVEETLTAKETSSAENKEDKPFWTPTRKVVAVAGLFLAVGVVAAIGAKVGAIAARYMMNNVVPPRVDPHTANCTSLSSCIDHSNNIRYSKELSPIAKEIETGLQRLAQMSDTDPGMSALKEDLAKKLFLDLPKYHGSYPLPAHLEHLRSTLFAQPELFFKDLDFMYEKNPMLLTQQILKALWRRFCLRFHPDKTGGDGKLLAQGMSNRETVEKCLKHRNEKNPPCRWTLYNPYGEINFRFHPSHFQPQR
ncbi:MAG TPA: hypothetical protein VLF94_02940 [Chlamydiales bacterium]|nr:hypothetical protein [Chlamydiales bacterium]